MRFSLSDALLNRLSLTARFLNDEEEEEDDEDWRRPMSPRPSEVSDEAADLRASAAARRATHCPMPEVPESVPRHFLLPTQGNPDIWAVRVKVWRIIHELNEGLSIVARPRGSPRLSTRPPLYPSRRRYFSQTHNRVGVFSPRDSGIYIHRRSTM